MKRDVLGYCKHEKFIHVQASMHDVSDTCCFIKAILHELLIMRTFTESTRFTFSFQRMLLFSLAWSLYREFLCEDIVDFDRSFNESENSAFLMCTK